MCVDKVNGFEGGGMPCIVVERRACLSWLPALWVRVVFPYIFQKIDHTPAPQGFILTLFS